MSWVNLDDVYVNKGGDSIAGNLSVGGALTINDGKGTNTAYNVANEITALHDSMSPTIVATTTSTAYTAFNIDLSKSKMVILVSGTKGSMRVICSSVDSTDNFVASCTSASSSMLCVYASEPANYRAEAYYDNKNKVLYLRSYSVYDYARLITV